MPAGAEATSAAAGAAGAASAPQQQGKKAQGTLWDQEKDELAIRILLEEGKLNLCLRTLQNFKECERRADFADVQAAVGQSFGVELSRVVERCKTFERRYVLTKCCICSRVGICFHPTDPDRAIRSHLVLGCVAMSAKKYSGRLCHSIYLLSLCISFCVFPWCVFRIDVCGARSIGALMRLSFNHVEALQILDLPNLIQHCAQCFATSLASDSAAAPFECEKMQDSLAVQVSCALASHFCFCFKNLLVFDSLLAFWHFDCVSFKTAVHSLPVGVHGRDQ